VVCPPVLHPHRHVRAHFTKRSVWFEDSCSSTPSLGSPCQRHPTASFRLHRSGFGTAETPQQHLACTQPASTQVVEPQPPCTWPAQVICFSGTSCTKGCQ
jgi:hypothetical protein